MTNWVGVKDKHGRAAKVDLDRVVGVIQPKNGFLTLMLDGGHVLELDADMDKVVAISGTIVINE